MPLSKVLEEVIRALSKEWPGGEEGLYLKESLEGERRDSGMQ